MVQCWLRLSQPGSPMSKSKKNLKNVNLAKGRGSKSVGTAQLVDLEFRSKPVQWSTAEVDWHAPERFTDWELDKSGLKELISFLEQLPKKTWNEWMNEQANGRLKHHSHSLDSLDREVRSRIEKIKLGDRVEELFRFRLSGLVRLWGFREGTTFYLLWFDRKHSVFPVGKRHT